MTVEGLPVNPSASETACYRRMGLPARRVASSFMRKRKQRQQRLPGAASQGKPLVAAKGRVSCPFSTPFALPHDGVVSPAILLPCGFFHSSCFARQNKVLAVNSYAVDRIAADLASTSVCAAKRGGAPSSPSVSAVHASLSINSVDGGNGVCVSHVDSGSSTASVPTPAAPLACKYIGPFCSSSIYPVTVSGARPATSLSIAARINLGPVTPFVVGFHHAPLLSSCPQLTSPAQGNFGSVVPEAAARSVSSTSYGRNFFCAHLHHQALNQQQHRKRQALCHELRRKATTADAHHSVLRRQQLHSLLLQSQQQQTQQQGLLQHRLVHHPQFGMQRLLQQPQVYQQPLRRNFSSGFPNTKKRITNPFWRRTGWWDWRRREVGKLNKARALRRHLWPRAAHASGLRKVEQEEAELGGVDGGLSSLSRWRVAGLAPAESTGAAFGEKNGLKASRSAAAAAAAAVKAAAAAVKHCTQKKPRWLEDDSSSRRVVILPVEGARQRPFWRQSKQKMLKRHRDAVVAAERASRSLAAAEAQEEEEDFAMASAAYSSSADSSSAAGRKPLGQVRLTQQDLLQVKKGRGRVWEERKDGIPLGKKRLLLYCRLIKGAQITDAIDWLSALCIHRVNYLLNLLLKTREKIHEEGGDISRVYIESYMLNIQGRAKRLQYRLRMVNFITTWKFAAIIRCRELPLDEFFHRLFILKKVPRSLTSDMRLALVEKRVPPGVIREWYPYLDASTRFWHRHRLRWLDRTRQFDYYVARKAFKATYEENCRRRRVQLLEARGATPDSSLLIEEENQA